MVIAYVVVVYVVVVYAVYLVVVVLNSIKKKIVYKTFITTTTCIQNSTTMKLTKYLAAILVPFSLSLGTVAGDFQIFDEVMPGNSVDENLNMKVLKNDVTGEYVKIIHDFGGRLEDLTLVSKSRNKLKQVLATHDNNASAVRANVHWAGAMLAPFANRIANGTYTFEENTYYLPRNEVRCNGKCDCALHGFLWNKAMHIAGTMTSGTSAKLILQYEFDGTDPGYPFVLNMTLTYELSATGLDIQVHAKNPSKTFALPFFHSLHPYFVAEDISKCIVEFDNCTGWNHMDMGPGFVLLQPVNVSFAVVLNLP